jgi:hypothetical protein
MLDKSMKLHGKGETSGRREGPARRGRRKHPAGCCFLVTRADYFAFGRRRLPVLP